HLCLVDLESYNISGQEAEVILGKAGITVNKNTIPRQSLSPFETSGIRIGTPTITSRGMKEEECRQIADWIAKAIRNKDSNSTLADIKKEVSTLCLKYPLYPEIRTL
ncbi:MAG TPA: serine hydroxymethyltransferase, partial [Methanocorpusculum sp.]|nr:serine hydroxymethyltransferase [Methanocorpusculum sp.]